MRAFGILTTAAVAGLAVGLGAAVQAYDRVESREGALRVQAERGQTMKGLGRAMRTVKLFTAGRGTREAAREAAAAIAGTASDLPSLFPAGTGMDVLADSEAASAIWENWSGFTAAATVFRDKAAVLEAALAAGDSELIGSAFEDLGWNGCGGCHRAFRQER